MWLLGDRGVQNDDAWNRGSVTGLDENMLRGFPDSTIISWNTQETNTKRTMDKIAGIKKANVRLSVEKAVSKRSLRHSQYTPWRHYRRAHRKRRYHCHTLQQGRGQSMYHQQAEEVGRQSQPTWGYRPRCLGWNDWREDRRKLQNHRLDARRRSVESVGGKQPWLEGLSLMGIAEASGAMQSQRQQTQSEGYERCGKAWTAAFVHAHC
jgi:hypothetical protein